MKLIKFIVAITLSTILITGSCFASDALKNEAKAFGIYSAADLNIKNIESVVNFLNSEVAQKFAADHYVSKEKIEAHIVLLKQDDPEAWSKLKSKLQYFDVIPDSQAMLDEAKELGIKSASDLNIKTVENVVKFLDKPHILSFAKTLFNKDDDGIKKQITLLQSNDSLAWYQLNVLATKVGLDKDIDAPLSFPLASSKRSG